MDGDGPSLASIEREGVVVFSKRSCEQSDSVQLDWPSETDTLKINLPLDQEGYDGFEYTDEKLYSSDKDLILFYLIDKILFDQQGYCLFGVN